MLSNAACEVSGRKLEQSDLRAAMRLKLKEIDAFKVATICTESTAQSLATKRVADAYRTLKPTAANHSPATSLEALRSVLAVHAARGGCVGGVYASACA